MHKSSVRTVDFLRNDRGMNHSRSAWGGTIPHEAEHFQEFRQRTVPLCRTGVTLPTTWSPPWNVTVRTVSRLNRREHCFSP